MFILAFNLRPDLDHSKVEAVWSEILLPRCKPITVGSCYRPPDYHCFINYFEDVEDVISKLPPDSEVIIMGDMNMCVVYVKNQCMVSMIIF